MSDPGTICPKCSSLIKEDLCPNCGFSVSEGADSFNKTAPNPDSGKAVSLNPDVKDYSVIEKSDSENSEDGDGVKENSKEEKGEVVDNPAVNSIFADMVSKSGVHQSISSSNNVEEEGRSKLFFLIPASLFFLLAGITAFAYYQFVYKSTVILSPAASGSEEVLSVSESGPEVPSANLNLNGAEKTVDLDDGLKEGNFEAYPFAKVIPPDVNLTVQLFDIKGIFGKFISDDKFNALLKEFDVTDNDVEVYFSDGFVIVYPYSDLSTWGYVQNIKNKDFIEKRLAGFEKKKESSKYEYKDYYAQIVEIQIEEGGSLIGSREDAASVPESEAKNQAEEADQDESSTEPPPGMLFLTVSNSKEFLDRMKEISEGNLPSLADDINFVQSKTDLPFVGDVYVYRNDDTPVWSLFLDKITPFFDYTGLDKILKEIKTTGTVFYSKDGKLKIQGSP
ncbi:hypothetical protein A2982_02100 [candidate division WWE3 bacterium RIFCSPLOWO2_01_FULL_39_13]|uniref:Uncharacterized protein n=1 Tax=candidate division WWE3 bacterium RIFCSPLOWO2_01_FULL_39_13 TaxID=1802624 RepID=A0A1F4V388_UNCKA|nr:MAG: hypothetical protein A2982_02100 [candidate division WWE3 bacterium RIFCSPLOWO2_01_FULL_39_13]